MKRLGAAWLILALSAAVLFGGFSVSAEYVLTSMYDSSTVNTGKDNGYSGTNALKKGDVHYGWDLGQFTMESYTDIITDNGVPVFLVNPGDGIILSYKLKQNIDSLNGKSNLAISDDKNGYDKAFQTKQTDFGRGALLIKFTDYRNVQRVTPYTDYLTGVKNKRANTRISLLEEGDYEVALDYEIVEKAFPTNKYHNYRTSFKFKIRNSNCMVYLRDQKTKSELANHSVAQHGFFLEYISFYQQIIVKREILTENGKGYSLTPRSCKAASNRAVYTDPGIYTVTVKNAYTGESLTMMVAVGDDPLINAYVMSDCVYGLDEISEMVKSGAAVITPDWRIEMIEKPKATAKPIHTEILEPVSAADNGMVSESRNRSIPLIAGLVIMIVSLGLVALLIKRRLANRRVRHTDSDAQKSFSQPEPILSIEGESLRNDGREKIGATVPAVDNDPGAFVPRTHLSDEPEYDGTVLDSASRKQDYAVGEAVVFGKAKWYVLANSGSRFLLLRQKPVEDRPYHTSDMPITWENCSLRKWIGTGFYNYQFSKQEKGAILQLRLGPERNKEWDTPAGNPTDDSVFCLGFREFNRYLPPNAEQAWWLRSPGAAENEAAVVLPSGVVESRPVSSEGIYVRPAMWIDVDRLES